MREKETGKKNFWKGLSFSGDNRNAIKQTQVSAWENLLACRDICPCVSTYQKNHHNLLIWCILRFFHLKGKETKMRVWLSAILLEDANIFKTWITINYPRIFMNCILPVCSCDASFPPSSSWKRGRESPTLIGTSAWEHPKRKTVLVLMDTTASSTAKRHSRVGENPKDLLERPHGNTRNEKQSLFY